MKLRLSIDRSALPHFFLEHVEKIVFGGIVVCGLLILYSAFGRPGHPKTPKDLMDAVINAEHHLKADRTAEVRSQFHVADYPAIARRSRIPVDEQPYEHTQPWDQPVRNPDVRRGTPLVLTVRDLEAHVGRGALLGGDRDHGRAPAAVEGHRWVLLTGLLPIQQQYDEYAKALSASVYRDPRTDEPRWLYFIIERAEVPPGSSAETIEFHTVSIEQLRSTVKRLGRFARQEDAYPDAVGAFTLPLPVRVDAPWGDDVYPEALTGPRFAQVQADPIAYRGQRVAWTAEAGVAADRRVVYPRRPFGATKETPPDYFAVDYPSADMARQWARQSPVTAAVVGDETVAIGEAGRGPRRHVPLLKYAGPSETIEPQPGELREDDLLNVLGGPSGPIRRPAAGPLRRPATGFHVQPPSIPAKALEPKLFRYLDLDVKPAHRYVYRVKVVVANPNFGKRSHQLLDAQHSRKKTLESPESPPTPLLHVPSDRHLLAISVAQPPRKTEPAGKLAVVCWVERYGIETFKLFPTWRGAVLDFRPEKVAIHVPGETAGPQTVEVDFSIGAMTVDMHSDGDVLVLEAGGALRVYETVAGRAELDTREEALRARRAASAATVDRPGGGLEFR